MILRSFVTHVTLSAALIAAGFAIPGISVEVHHHDEETLAGLWGEELVLSPRLAPEPEPEPEPEIVPARPSQPTRAARARPPIDVILARIRYCESRNNYQAVSRSGTYRGAYQFNLQTWQSVGGTGDPAEASPAEQELRARILYERRGVQPWPVCGQRALRG